MSDKQPDFLIRDMPVTLQIKTHVDKETGVITQENIVMAKITPEVIDTKSKQIRDGLISLGWTPPNEN